MRMLQTHSSCLESFTLWINSVFTEQFRIDVNNLVWLKTKSDKKNLSEREGPWPKVYWQVKSQEVKLLISSPRLVRSVGYASRERWETSLDLFARRRLTLRKVLSMELFVASVEIDSWLRSRTTYMSLRGSRTQMIFKYSETNSSVTERIDTTVFPALQTVARQIGALAALQLEVTNPCKHFGCDGTDTLPVFLDRRPHELTGSEKEKVCGIRPALWTATPVLGSDSTLSADDARIGTLTMISFGWNEF